MGKIIIGILAGYIFSDLISAKIPQAQQFKIGGGVYQQPTAAPKSSALQPILTDLQKLVGGAQQ